MNTRPLSITCFQRALLGLGSAAGSLLNPERGDLVATFSEVAMPGPSLTHMRNLMRRDSIGRIILEQRRAVTDADLIRWESSPAGRDPTTMPGAYVAYMRGNGFLPSGRSPVRFLEDPEQAYVMQRYRECHDFMHCLLGLGRTEPEEMLLKVIEFYHTQLPMASVAVVGQIARDVAQSGGFWGSASWNALPWALQVATSLKVFYLNVDWEGNMDRGRPIEELRAEMGL